MAKAAPPAMSESLQVRTVEFTPLGEAASITLSIQQLKIAGIVRPTKQGHMPDDGTILTFMLRCKAQGLNPFVGDAFLLGYDSQSGPEFSLITAVQSLYKRAELAGDFDGMESGVIVENTDGELLDLPGDFVPRGTTLVGAWAKGWRKSMTRPVTERMNREPFDKKRSQWSSNPQGMLVKVAEASVLRRLFPTTCGGLYTQDELPDDSANTLEHLPSPKSPKPKRISETIPRPAAPPIPASPAEQDRQDDPQAITEEELFRALSAELSDAPDYATAVTIASGYIDRNPPLEEKIHAGLVAMKKLRGWK